MEYEDFKIGMKIRILGHKYDKSRSYFFGKVYPVGEISHGQIGITTGIPQGHTHWFDPDDLELVEYNEENNQSLNRTDAS